MNRSHPISVRYIVADVLWHCVGGLCQIHCDRNNVMWCTSYALRYIHEYMIPCDFIHTHTRDMTCDFVYIVTCTESVRYIVESVRYVMAAILWDCVGGLWQIHCDRNIVMWYFRMRYDIHRSYTLWDIWYIWIQVTWCAYVSFTKEPCKRDDILQKRPVILRSLLIVATP